MRSVSLQSTACVPYALACSGSHDQRLEQGAKALTSPKDAGLHGPNRQARHGGDLLVLQAFHVTQRDEETNIFSERRQRAIDNLPPSDRGLEVFF
jgi:hypothetical protein